MNCNDFGAAISGHITKSLASAEREAFEKHRDSCPRCATELASQNALCCRELVQVLDAYIDGELEVERRVRFERHISLCPHCLDYLESYRVTIELTRRSGSRNANPKLDEMPEVLVRAILDSLGGRGE